MSTTTLPASSASPAPSASASASEAVDSGWLALRQEALHAAIADPAMDSMRILSETAMKFPDALSFSSGAPYDGNHDLADLSFHIDRYVKHLQERGVPQQRITRTLFQYGPVNGFIQDDVARMLRQDENIDVPSEAIMITHGFQEATLVALRGLFAGPDDVLLSVSPAYVGIRGAARMLDIPVEGIDEGPDGLDPEAVAAAARAVRAGGRRPVALYLVPDFSNPSGTVLPLEARRRLLEVAAEEDLVILEDNPYGLFARDGESMPTLKSLDTAGRVVYLGSFAKSAFPGARLGYLVADQPVTAADGVTRTLAQELSRAKAMFSVGSSSLSQAVVGGILVENGHTLRPATRELAAVYLERLQATLDSLAEHFPPERYAEHQVRWNTPRGGFFLTVEVGFEAGLAEMERCARDYGVSWAPMSMFHIGGGGERQIRLGFSNLAPEAIREGIARLARFISASPHA
ncbi:PLP-dependent aminotransferase family protein [Streptomyces sp. NPDC002698]|uniref:aminotransferase-like domain-containing protein n=1 Tax=Streptomyces sp. NPDC002698 TaxID=3364660 RepID=UPI0036A70B71